MIHGIDPCFQHARRVKGAKTIRFPLIEGFNNLVSRMVHKACGLRNLDDLELRFRYHSAMR